eukprot:553176-Rhodomonas_salina.1
MSCFAAAALTRPLLTCSHVTRSLLTCPAWLTPDRQPHMSKPLMSTPLLSKPLMCAHTVWRMLTCASGAGLGAANAEAQGGARHDR